MEEQMIEETCVCTYLKNARAEGVTPTFLQAVRSFRILSKT
jgi:hypothetical protein